MIDEENGITTVHAKTDAGSMPCTITMTFPVAWSFDLT
jgi:hypothetical protein